MTELSDLPPKKRMQRYLDLADDARREAARTTGSLREAYLIIARNWEDLAADTAKQHNLEPDTKS